MNQIDMDASSWAAAGGVASVIVAIFAAVIAWRALLASNRVQVVSQMQSYLTAYRETIVNFRGAFNEASFEDRHPDEKRIIQIVSGMLVSLVDAMVDAKDPRLDIWLGYIGRLPSQLFEPEWALESFARNNRVKKEIEKLRRARQAA